MRLFRKTIAAALAATVALLSPGLGGWQAAAQVVEGPALPEAVPLSAAPAVPTQQADPGVEALPSLEGAVQGLEASLEGAQPLSPTGERAVSLDRELTQSREPDAIAPTLDRVFDESVRVRGAIDVPDSVALPIAEDAPSSRAPRRVPIEKRSAIFPLMFAAGTGAAAFGIRALGNFMAAGARQIGTQAAAPHAVHAAAVAVGAAAAAFAAAGVFDVALFAYMKWAGRKVSQDQFRRFVERNYPQYKALIRDYLPSEKRLWFSYGFHSGSAVYMRRELAAVPWLFQLVLTHELEHVRTARPESGPARSFASQMVTTLGREVKAYSREVLAMRRVRREGLPLLWRAMAAAQVSLRLSSEFDVLAVDAEKDADLPRTLGVLSNGKARLTPLSLRGSLTALRALAESRDGRGRFRGLVLYGASAWLPDRATLQATLLSRAFRQLESVLAEGEKRRASKPQISLDNRLQKAWRHVYEPIQALGPVRILESAYEVMKDRGVAVLPFTPNERGLDAYERLLRFYTARDGGRFAVTRVDLAEGGHVLVLRKLEPRVNLWVSPPAGGVLEKTLTNVSGDPARAQEAWKLLEKAGLGRQRALFEKNGIEIRHVFGADKGENRVYISAPRVAAAELKKLAQTEPDLRVQPSQAGFYPQLYAAGPALRIDQAHAKGWRGKGMKVAGVDTGVDASHPDYGGRVVAKDEVNGGEGDANGHGSHTLGIMVADGGRYQGMAPEAQGWMGKVFAEGGMGASDGDIMAALSDALDWGADVINLSLGSRGGPNETLAKFVSGLTEKKNSAGRRPVIFASAGNSGPFHQVLSQPAAGAHVVAVAGFVRTPVQGARLPAFFSSSGFAWDDELKIWLPKPEMGGISGNVTSTPDFYADGVESTKSGQKPSSGSDAEDGKHTRMSGTSQAAPGLAGIAALVLEVARRAEEKGVSAAQYLKDHAPLAVRAIMMRTHRDAKVPLSVSLSGLADADAAVGLAAHTLGMDGPSLPVRLWRKLFGTRGPPEVLDWTWIDRYARILDAGRSPFVAAKVARTAFLETLKRERPEAFPQKNDDKDAARKKKGELGRAGEAAFAKALGEAKAPLLPLLIGSLDAKAEPVWSNRLMAAFALMNYKEPSAADALLEAGLGDPDSRVRQMALRALAETPTHRGDPMLKNALQSELWDVRLYAAMALARHGDPVGLGQIAALMGERSAPDAAEARFSAAYVAGELADSATPELAETLGARVADAGEIDSVRHAAAASLAEIVLNKDAAVTDKTLLSLISAGGPQENVLSHTISRVFGAIAGRAPLAARFRTEPVQAKAVEFVQRYREWVNLGGPVADLVRSLAKLAGIRLDLPTPPVDPGGKGVKGVDGRLGPVQLFVKVPEKRAKLKRFGFFRDRAEDVSIESAAAGLDPAVVEKHEGRLRATLPVYNAITLEVPEANRAALARELEAKGFEVYAARPVFGTLKDTGRLSQMDKLWAAHAGEGVTIAVVDEGADVSHPAFAGRVRAAKNFTDEGAPDDVSSESVGHGTHVAGIAAGEAVDGSPYRGMAPKAKLVFAKVLGANGGTDVQVMEGQAWAASLSKDPLKDPIIINESLGGPGTPEDPLSLAANKLVLGHVGLVAAAGNEGPKTGTVGSPANAALSIAVGSVDKERKLAFYSSREVEGKKLGGWLDFGGGAYFGRDNPYEIVSALSGRLPWGDRATTLWWPDREKGKPLYQYMSGTSQASPHTAGKLAVLIGQMLQAFGGELPAGYVLWLRSFVEAHLTKTPFAEHEQGAGLFDNAADISAALAERLKDLGSIRAEAAALQQRAEKEHGSERTPPGAGTQVSIYDSIVDLRTRAGGPSRPLALDLGEGQGGGLQELKRVLSSGGTVEPFLFRPYGRGEYRARSAGLEGFLYSKRELERTFGPKALERHWPDYRAYLEKLLGPSLAPSISQALDKKDDAALDDALESLVQGLQSRLEAADPHGWIRRTGIYELFPRAYNLEGRRNGAKGRFFDAWRDEDFDAILADHPRVGALYLLGVWKPNQRVKLGWKGSPFSIQDPLTVDPDLGDNEGLKRFIELAHARGLKVILDVVPNHAAIDSVYLETRPEAFMTRPAGEGAPPPGWFEYTKRDGTKLWAAHAGMAGGGWLDDSAQVDISKPEGRRLLLDVAQAVVRNFGADGLRLDLLDHMLNDSFARRWGVEMPKTEPAAELAEGVDAALLGEAYWGHEALSAAGVQALYNKAAGGGEGDVGWYNSLAARRAWRIRRAIDHAAFLSYSRGAAAGAQMVFNHDEPAEPRVFGSFWKGAYALTALLPTTRLTYAGSEVHADFATPETERREGPKAVVFSRDVKIDWSSNPEVREFKRRVEAQAAAFYAGRPDARRLERVSLDSDEWAGYVVPSSNGTLFVAANPTERPITLKLRLDGGDVDATIEPGGYYAAVLGGKPSLLSRLAKLIK